MQQQATNVNTKPSVSSTAPANWLTMLKRSTYAFPLIGLVAVSLVMILTTDNFLSADNFLNIARQVSINAIIAIGMTCAILSGGIDVGAKAEIYMLMRRLTNEGYAIIFISSELPEIVGLCDRVAVFRQGAIVATLAGDEINSNEVMRYATTGN